MKNKIIFIYFLFFSLIIPFNIYSDISEIQNRGYITIGIYHRDSFPFFFHDKNNDFKGIDVDIAKEIGKNMGVKIMFNREAKTFDSLTDLLLEKKVDLVISWFSRTLKRAKRIRFSNPYFIDRQSFLLNRLKTAKFFKSKNILKNLNNKNIKIGTVKGTSYVDFIKRIAPKANIILYKNWDMCFNDTLKGKLEASFWTEIGILNSFNAYPEAGIYVKKIPLDRKDYICIGTQSKDYQLLYWVNIFLKLKNYKFTAEKLLTIYSKELRRKK